jgi:hypothetical protein
MAKRFVGRWSVYALGTFGLLLVTLVGSLAPHAAAEPRTSADRVRRWLARRALDGIGAIGWCVDRLPPAIGPGRAPKLTGNRINTRPV